jgi:hypothetical protein
VNWIKVSTGLMRDAKVGAIADACRCDIPKAAGMVLGVLLTIPSERPDANVADVPDATLEAWAMWTGRRGVFARAFRQAWCLEGTVAAWEKWNGASQRELAAKKQRAKEWRESRSVSVTVSDTLADTVRTPCAPKKEEGRGTTGNYEQEEVDIPCPAADAAPPPDEVLPWVAPRGHGALRTLLAHVPDVQAWVGILRGFASGLNMDQGRPCDPERLAIAVEDFVAKGKHLERHGPSPKLFRAFVKSSKAPIRQYADQQTEAEYQAEILHAIRRQNDRNRRIGQPLKPEPDWAPQIDAMFPDGRTRTAGVAA